jgi:Ca-activated chloride channel family protein
VTEWASPAWFAALPLALLPWWAWGRAPTLAFGSLASVRAPVGPRVGLSVMEPLLGSLALVAVVVALARPQEVRRESIRETPGLDIMLALDTSASMDQADMAAGNGGAMSRLDAARVVMTRFLEGRPDDRVGLLLFGEEAFVQVPLTLDHEALASFIGQVQIGMAGRNATAVGSAVAVAAKRMKALKAPSRVVILVTDGQSNAGAVSPVQAAQAAQALGIRVYTIGVGGGGRGLLGILGAGGNDVDEPTLRAVASTTGGKYYRATDTEALAAVYADIDTLEVSTARSREFVHRDELYLPWLVGGLVAWIAQGVLSQTWLRRLP